MLELPEAAVIAEQINRVLTGKKIENVTAAFSPNKFAWYNGKPEKYHQQLAGKRIEGALRRGGMIQVQVRDKMLVFSDGVKLASHPDDSNIPKKHQLLVRFTDKSYLSASIQMYGGIICADTDDYDNDYYRGAVSKPDLLGPDFSPEYFLSLTGGSELKNKSVKFVIATEQRIPGLGNGVLQDILYNARIHPKRRWDSLSQGEVKNLYESIRTTMGEIIEKGGRDTEKDLFGKPGGYRTKMSKNTAGTKCVTCGTPIEKAAYMGGSVYFCGSCQKL